VQSPTAGAKAELPIADDSALPTSARAVVN
jgi:hypothetical protein